MTTMTNPDSTPRTEKIERLSITQDLTIYHAEALKDELLHALERGNVIELDLAQVTEIDTAGIQLLMLTKRECQQHDQTLRIVAHSQSVHDLIDFYNIAGFFGDPLLITARDAT